MNLPAIATKKQRILFDYGSRCNYSLLCADPRLGKTPVAIWLQQYRNVNCLVVCPSYLVLNWKKEINKWSPKSQVTVFRKGSEIYEPCDSEFVVISYDLVQKAEHLFEWCDMVVCDEIHNIKSMSAKRSEFLHRCIFEYSIKYVHGLTGTPLKNRVREFYSLLALMYYDPEDTDINDDLPGPFSLVGKNYVRALPPDQTFLEKYPDEITFAERFSHRYSYNVEVKTKKGAKFKKAIVKYEGLKNVKELRRWLQGKYIRLRADAGDLPPITFQDILISDSPDKALLDSFNAYFSGEDTGKVRPDLKVKAALKKVPFTIKYVENLMETVGCCLVYSDHREPIQAIAKHFKVPAITGEMPANRRAKMVQDFQAGKINMLCATIGSLKEGADLFRSRDIVLNDPCWVSGDLLQVINRIRAIGEKDPRTVHRMFGSPQDEKIYEALEYKQKIIDQAT